MIALLIAALAPVDSDYLQKAGEDNVAELRMVRMVARKTHNSAVKRACEVMIADHTKQLHEVQDLGRRFSVEIPREPSVKHEALFDNMSKKTGRDLDRSFTAAQIQDHIKDINDAHDETEIGRDRSVREFAQKAVKTFARHAHIWRNVAKRVGVPVMLGRPSAEQILAGRKIGD